MANTVKKGKEKHKRKINTPVSVWSVLVVQIVDLLTYCLLIVDGYCSKKVKSDMNEKNVNEQHSQLFVCLFLYLVTRVIQTSREEKEWQVGKTIQMKSYAWRWQLPSYLGCFTVNVFVLLRRTKMWPDCQYFVMSQVWLHLSVLNWWMCSGCYPNLTFHYNVGCSVKRSVGFISLWEMPFHFN